jgi:PhnB protein
MQVHPYLIFGGNCAEAVEFYRLAVGAEVQMLMRYKDAPDPAMVPPGRGDHVMHVSLRIGEGTVMASDSHQDASPPISGFALSITPADETEARRAFDALSEGGSVQMPLGPTFWARAFGMLTDRFGVAWMVNVEK